MVITITIMLTRVKNQPGKDTAGSGMSGPANRPMLVEEADARSEIWKYFTFVADSEGKPTDTTKPVCKSVMTKGANTSNLAKHLADRHADLFKQFKELQDSLFSVLFFVTSNFFHQQSCTRQSGVKLTV